MQKLLLVCLREKFGKFYILYYICFSVLAILLDTTLAYTMLFTLIIFTAFQVTRIFSVPSINCINTGYPKFRKHKPRYQLSMAFLTNILWLLVLEIKALTSNADMALGILLIWIYAIVIGVTIGNISENEVLGYIAILGCFFLCLQKTLIHELYLRYVSPVLIFNNECLLSNIIGITILILVGILSVFITSKKRFALAAVSVALCFAGLVMGELHHERSLSKDELLTLHGEEYRITYHSNLHNERVSHIAQIIHETERCLGEYGFDFDTLNYQMECSTYFPWESSQEKVLFTYTDGSCNINFYTESMREIADDELITRYIYSRLRQDNQFQEVAVQILAEDITAQVLYSKRTELLDDFSYEHLVDTYGYCASPKQCLAVECMKMDSASFANLYTALGEIEQLNELEVDRLSTDEAFRKMVGSIVK